MDRPSRKTKAVNYCEAKDFDADEDFADTKAPPSKKTKEDLKKEHKHSSSRSLSQETNSPSSQSQKNRKPLDEKLLNRDLEAAITLSLLNDANGEKERCHINEEIKVEMMSGENVDPSSLLRSNCSVDADILGLDKITSENQSRRQKKTEEKKKKDEDYEPKLTPDSESDEDFSEPDESDDEEFTVKKTSKAKKKEKTTKSEKPKTSPAANKAKRPSKAKSQATASAAMKSPPAVKPAARSSLSPKPSASVSPAGGRIPKWTPPAQIGKSPTSCQRPVGRSPGQGLRLGLSRLVRVKPLHPSVASH